MSSSFPKIKLTIIHTVFFAVFYIFWQSFITIGSYSCSSDEKSYSVAFIYFILFFAIRSYNNLQWQRRKIMHIKTIVTSRDSTATSNKQVKKPIKGSRQHYSECDFIDASYRQIYRSIG